MPKKVQVIDSDLARSVIKWPTTLDPQHCQKLFLGDDSGFTCSCFLSVTIASVLFNFFQAQAMVEIVKQLGWSYVSTVAAQV